MEIKYGKGTDPTAYTVAMQKTTYTNDSLSLKLFISPQRPTATTTLDFMPAVMPIAAYCISTIWLSTLNQRLPHLLPWTR